MGSVLREPGAGAAVVFVETILPDGCDGVVLAGGIEYVREAVRVPDLPAGVLAARVRDVAYLPELPDTAQPAEK